MELLRDEADICVPYLDGQHKTLKLKQKIVFSTKIYYIFRPGEHLEYSSPKRFRHYLVEKVERRMTRPMKPLTEPQTINNFFEAFSLPAEAQASGSRKLAMIINTKRMDTDINSSARHSSKKARGKPRYHRTTKERKKENEINRRRENQKSYWLEPRKAVGFGLIGLSEPTLQ